MQTEATEFVCFVYPLRLGIEEEPELGIYNDMSKVSSRPNTHTSRRLLVLSRAKYPVHNVTYAYWFT
jgi:hypothetical protein